MIGGEKIGMKLQPSAKFLKIEVNWNETYNGFYTE